MFCRNCGTELTGSLEFCTTCGAKPMNGTRFCPWCGAQTTPMTELCVQCGTRVAEELEKKIEWDISPKSRLATTLLAFFLGGFGAHRFYIGKLETAIVMLFLGIVSAVTGGLLWLLVGQVCGIVLGIWVLVDFFVAVTGNMKDNERRLIKKW